MTHAREMLGAFATPVPMAGDEVGDAIDACLTCAQACTSCGDADLAEEGVENLRRCVALDRHCAEVCTAVAGVLSRPAYWDEFVVHHLLQACVRLCASCGEECAQHAAHHRHCAICERACRACERACRDLLDSEAFAELRNLAGG